LVPGGSSPTRFESQLGKRRVGIAEVNISKGVGLPVCQPKGRHVPLQDGEGKKGENKVNKFSCNSVLKGEATSATILLDWEKKRGRGEKKRKRKDVYPPSFRMVGYIFKMNFVQRRRIRQREFFLRERRKRERKRGQSPSWGGETIFH